MGISTYFFRIFQDFFQPPLGIRFLVLPCITLVTDLYKLRGVGKLMFMIRKSYTFSKRILAIIGILILILLLLSACSGGDPLYGTWEEPISKVQLEIKSNGDILTTLNGTTFTMKYKLEVPDVLILQASKDGSVPDQRITYLATKDNLTLTVDGVNTIFDRVK